MRANYGTVGSRTSKERYTPADISASLPQVGLLTVHVGQHQREVCRLSRGVMSQPLSDPLQIGLRLLPPPLPAASSASLASCFPVRQLLVLPGDYGLTTFRRCTRVVEVASLRRRLAICAGGVRRLRTWPRTVLVQAVQQLALVLCDDACDASPGLTLPTPSWFPTALLLAVAVTARAWAALPWEEATLCRELRTAPLPVMHVPVGYCWQNSRCCQSVPQTAAQLHRRLRVAPERKS